MDEKFQEMVNASLNSAIDNGYELDDWSAEEIAEDLAQYDSSFDSYEPSQLVPYILIWKAAHRPFM